MAGRCRKKIMSTSIINHLTWFQDINLAAAKSTLISRNQVYLQCILPPRVHLQWLIHSQGAVMHMPVNKPNVNCTYDSSHGTDEIYPKGPPHIYIYTYLHLYLYIYVYICIINIYICTYESAPNCCSTSEVGSGDLKKRMTVSHTCPKLWKQCMRDEVKKLLRRPLLEDAFWQPSRNAGF